MAKPVVWNRNLSFWQVVLGATTETYHDTTPKIDKFLKDDASPEILVKIAKHTQSDANSYSLLRTCRYFRDALTVPFGESNGMQRRGATAIIHAVR